MKDIPIIITILIFWFGVAWILTGIYNSGFINTNSEFIGNASTDITAPTANFNATSISDSESVLSMLGKIFTFRLPASAFPAGINTVVSTVNLILLIIMGLMIYRLIRSGAG